MKNYLNEHFKLFFFWGALIITAITFYKVFTVVFFAFSIAIVVEPVYINLLKIIQRHHYRTGFWSQIILIMFLVGVTVFAGVIFVLPLYYLQKNFLLIVEMASKFALLLESGAHKYLIPIETIRNFISGAADFLLNTSADLLRSAPEHFTNVLIFYITLFASIKYFRDGKRDLVALAPVSWLKVIRHLYLRVYEVLRAFYVVHIFIALLVFFLSLLLFKILKLDDIVFFSLITSILQLIPFVGAASMMIGMFVFYLMKADYYHLLLILLLGFPLLVILPEMIVRPWMMGRNAKISMTLILLGVLAGMKCMGIIGLVFGPVLLVLCQEMLFIVKERYGEKTGNPL